MGLKITCSCGHVEYGETEDEVLAKGAKHAKEVHNYSDEKLKDPETIKHFKSLIEKV